MPVKAVIFDLGDVFIDVDSAKALRELRVHCAANAKPEGDVGGIGELVRSFESGEVSVPQFYDAVCRHERLALDLERFSAIYCDIFSPVAEMIEANAALRGKGLPTYLFSNTSELHFRHIRSRYAFMSDFTGYCLSYELKCMKPDARIYAAVERKTGYGGSELLYIDDRLENIQAGASRGWQAIHHTGPEQTLAALRARALL